MKVFALATASLLVIAHASECSLIFQSDDYKAVGPEDCKPCSVKGLDIRPAGLNPNAFPWATLSDAYSFAFIQTTYGISVTGLLWNDHKTRARSAGFITGGVHHPNPSESTPEEQARVFTSFGGGWVADSKTLPGALYLGANVHNATDSCYNLTPAQWVSWIQRFTNTYHNFNLGRYPIILTSAVWWKACTGNSAYTGGMKLWLLGNHVGPTPLPGTWVNWKFWEYKYIGPYRVHSFNGELGELAALTI